MAQNPDTELYDVVVVGAGFAGLTAARELSRRGLSVLIVEARHRIGGRTWLDHRLGRDLEIGGTWVHWTQPYVWAELKRYGLDTTPGPDPERAYWWAAGACHEGAPDELLALIGQTNGDFVKESRTYFPEPFKPLAREDFKAIDEVSVLARIREQFPAGAARDVLESFWTLNFNGPLEDAALTQALRWVELPPWRPQYWPIPRPPWNTASRWKLFRTTAVPWTSAAWTGVPSARGLRSSLFRCTRLRP